MTERSYPFVDGTTTDAEFSAMFGQVFPASVIGGLQVFADATGLNVKVPAGAGFVRGHYYSNSDTQTLTVQAGESNPRIDTIVLRLEYGSANSISLQVKKGTAAASPVRPALTQTLTGIYEYPIADVAVAANAVTISAAAVTDRRVFYADALKQLLGLYQMAASVIVSGQFDPARIPALDASKTTTGVFDTARVPHLAASADSLSITADPNTSTGTTYMTVGMADPTRLFTVVLDGVLKLRFDNTGTMINGAVPWGNVTGQPTTFPAAWSGISGKPSAFTPSAHTHGAGDITSGQLNVARIPYMGSGDGVTYLSTDPSGAGGTGRTYLGVRYGSEGGSTFYVNRSGVEVFNVNASGVVSAGSSINSGLDIYANRDLACDRNLMVPNGQAYFNSLTAASSSYVIAYIDGSGRLSKGASSERFKEHISVIEPASLGDLFPQLKRYHMRDGDGVWRYGYTAEQIAANPDTEQFAVYERQVEEDGTAPHLKRDADGNPIPESIDFIGLLIAQNAQLNARAVAAESRLDALEARFAALEGGNP